MKNTHTLLSSIFVLTLFINHTVVSAIAPTNARMDILPDIRASSSLLVAGASESFEDIPSNWIVETDVNGAGSTVTRSNVQKYTGTYSASAFTTNSNSKAQVRDVIPGNWSSVPTDAPGTFIWQRAYVYVPSATANALTGNEYLDLGGLFVSGDSSGFYLRLRASGTLYALAPGSSGQAEFNLYGSFPLDQWVEVELGLWSRNTGDLDRAGCFIINGKFYGWFTNARSGTNYDRAAMGIVATNSPDNLTVHIDDWYIYDTGTSPTGTDNRPTGTSYIKDFTTQSGENIGYHYNTWENGYTLDANYGLFPSGRIQASIETSKMPDLSDGWSQIVVDWTGGNTPSWPPDLIGTFFGPMIGFRKSVEFEENLEIVPVYRSSTKTVDLVFESWTIGPKEYASWQLPMDGSGHTIPGQGDIIRVRWQEVSATEIRVRVDYYDASAGTWLLDVIDHTRALNNVNGVNFLVDTHGAVTNTIDSNDYTIKSQTVGTLATFANPIVTIFADVPSDYWALQYIERLYNADITGGCTTNPLNYCPEASVTRAQMAIFLERGMHYPAVFTPPNVTPTFTDTVNHWAEDWIEALKNDGITSGCGTGLYCPEAPVTRAQMAVFLLRAKYGSTYNPPAVGASTGFGDIPIDYWAGAWIKQLVAESITSGCGSGNYCPDTPVTRAQMAVFLVKTFGLP